MIIRQENVLLIAKIINKADKPPTAQVAGETGIDIYERNKDKGQIIKDFDSEDTISLETRWKKQATIILLLKKNITGYNITVKDWEETFNKLLLIKAMGILK